MVAFKNYIFFSEAFTQYNELAFVFHSFLRQWNQLRATLRMNLIKLHVREFLCEYPLCCLHTCWARRNITAPFVAPVKVCHQGDVVATTDTNLWFWSQSFKFFDREISEHLLLILLINLPDSVFRYVVGLHSFSRNSYVS